MKSTRRSLVLMMLVIFAVQGCKRKQPTEGLQEAPPEGEKHAAPQEPAPAESQPSVPAVEAPEADVKAASDAINGFALDLYGNFNVPKDRNCFFSPYSIAEVLTLASSGAAGATRDGMRKVLRLTLEDEPGLKAVAALRSSMSSTSVSLQSANRLWGQKDAVIKQPFQDAASKYFGAGLEPVDFKDDPGGSCKKINGWIEKETSGRIGNLVTEDAVSAATLLLLTNAVYFKGAWDKPFDPKRTSSRPFHVPGKQDVQAPMMNHDPEDYPYAAVDGVRILEMPYKGGEISMVILLPEASDEAAPVPATTGEPSKMEGGLAELETKLTKENLDTWLAALEKTHIAVSLPRFTMQCKSMLEGALETMGMAEAFKETADFAGISDAKPWFIGAVVHGAFVEVNEQGTEAAAATAVTGVMGRPLEFNADHPFVFIIKDNRTSTILFMGRVVDPTAG